MPQDKSLIKGKVTAIVFDKNGNVKRFPQTPLQKALKIQGKPMIAVNHNAITNEGDAICADVLSGTGARTAFSNANAKIVVGTGWTGTSIKTQGVLNAISGSARVMTTSYPKLKGTFGNANDNVVQYRSNFTAGLLKTTGLDEAAIVNNATPASADMLAYAQVTPSLNVSTDDTLQVDWEITFLGTT